MGSKSKYVIPEIEIYVQITRYVNFLHHIPTMGKARLGSHDKRITTDES